MIEGVLFKPAAEGDLEEAYQWYESRRAGLGDEFLMCVEAAVAAARRDPEAAPIVRAGVRRALLRRFPFGVFYVVEPECLVVLAVYHSSRAPGGWRRRGRRSSR